jgi:hypothetical protein
MDTVLIDGDMAMFVPAFGMATVVVQPGQLTASGPATLGKKKLCVVGDESSVSVPGCTYMTAMHSIPGVGTLEIAALAGDQQAQKTKTGGTRLMLVGSQFTARFKVSAPAMQPPPGPGSPVPDGTPEYSGQGSFLSMNIKLKAT